MPTPSTIGPSIVAGDATSTSVQRTFQRKAFFALGRHWVFYANDGGFLVYDSSVGGSEAWLGPEILGGMVPDGGEFTVWLQEISPLEAYVHLVWADSNGNSPIIYLRGTLAPNGTISWDLPDEAAPFDLGWEYENLGICMDFQNRIYVVYNKVDSGDPTKCTIYVSQSTSSDGTWTMGGGFPLQITALEDGSWIPLIAPYYDGVLVVYTTAGGGIFSRVMDGDDNWGPEVETDFVMGMDPTKISIVSERMKVVGEPIAEFWARAVYVAYQAGDWDLYSIRYENDAWQPAPPTRIEAIGPFREANPMLSVLYTGEMDPLGELNHPPGTLYCFWTPTTDSPVAQWVTYRLSVDRGETWIDEDDQDQARSWINETANGFEVQQSGSTYFHSSEDYDNARSYLGIVYVTHMMPPALWHAALGFEDPDEDLPAEFIVRNIGSEELPAEFIVRYSAALNLPGAFIVRHTASVNLPGEFIARHTTGVANLPAEFIVRHANSENLLGEFIVRHTATPLNLPAEFIIRRTATQDLYAEFEVGQGAEDLKAIFWVNQGAEDLFGEFIVRQTGIPVNLFGKFIVRQETEVEILGEFIVRHTDAANLPAQFEVGQGDENLFAKFEVIHTDIQDLPAEFFVRNADAEDLLGEFIVRHEDIQNLPAEFIVRQASSQNLLAYFSMDKDFISKGLNVSVYRDLTVIS